MGTGPLTYLWLVLRRAWQHSFRAAHSIILALIICGGILTYCVPQIQVMVDLGGWQVAALTMGGILAVRLVLAPYWLWKDQQVLNQRMARQLDQRKAREEALHELALLRARIAKLRIRMEADAQSKVNWTKDFESLRAQVANKIKEGFGPAEAELYTTAGNLVQRSSVRVADRNHQLQLEFCIRDLDFLDEFIRRHSAAVSGAASA
jgi:hypothetical protein